MSVELKLVHWSFQTKFLHLLNKPDPPRMFRMLKISKWKKKCIKKSESQLSHQCDKIRVLDEGQTAPKYVLSLARVIVTLNLVVYFGILEKIYMVS